MSGSVVLLLAAALWATGTNIAPDAVTRATQGFNTYSGELTYLTDGLTPDNSEQPGVFAWPTKGNLVFQFEDPRLVAGVRLRIGTDAGSYAAIASLGAVFDSSGQTETTAGSFVADVYDTDFQADHWVELMFPDETLTDYIELMTESGAEIYEVEILSVGQVPSAIPAVSWGAVKIK